MRLLTLGGLSLENVSFGRVKPLLLLTYLALEGPKERRHLAELFWPGASDPMNSLSAALTRLRKGLGGAVEADEVRAWADVDMDAAELVSALESGDLETALALYQGPFLHGAYLPDWSAELEEWVYAKREDLAGRVRRGMLALAENEAARGRFGAAMRQAEAAHALSGAPEVEPEDLTRLYLLLQAGGSHLAAPVRDEAESYDIGLTLSRDEARARLQRVLVGREGEAARLGELGPGEWAWLGGGPGMGKTALLKSLAGTFLYGRSGLPYATLAPLVGPSLQAGEAAMLGHMLKLEGRWLFDNWSRIDEASQRVLVRLRELRPRASVVITSRESPPFPVDVRLELGSISKEALEPDAWEKTQGLPALVEAYLRNEPLEGALETRLEALSTEARDVYFALALLDKPDLALVRRALRFEAAVTARVLEELLAAGFIEPSGQVRVRQAAQEYLEAHPTKLGPSCLSLARVVGELEAFPLFARSRHLWTHEDEPKAAEAYLAWADELLKRGFPQQAFEVLEDAPDSRAVVFLKARALERAGRFREALDMLSGLADTPHVFVLKASLKWRLGKPDEAKALAERALEDDGESLDTRADAFNTLGHLARSRADYQEAVTLFKKAAALWRAQGNRARWADALNNVGLSWGEGGAEPERIAGALREALEAAGDHPVLQARILNNLGSLVYERQRNFDEAERAYRTCIRLDKEFGLLDTGVRAWNNLGVSYHLQARVEEARAAYEQALELAQRAGDKRILGCTLANLAELNEDPEYWEEALSILKTAGYHADAARLVELLLENHPFRVRSGEKV